MTRTRVCRLDKCREDEPDQPAGEQQNTDDHEGHDDDAMQPAGEMQAHLDEERATKRLGDRVQPANIEGELRRGLRQGHDNVA